MARVILRRAGLGVLIAIAASAGWPAASGAFPGRNGSIGYTTGALDYSAPSSIVAINADGLTGSVFVDQDFQDDFPAFSADGQSVAWTNGDPSLPGTGIFVQDFPSGMNRSVVSPPPLDALKQPAWSPAKTSLAFAGSVPGQRSFQIWRVNLTTGALQRLTSLGGSEPNWSTGQKILFARNGQIFYINNDGSHRVQLTYRGGDRAKWSPHGAKVTFQRTIRGNTDVYTINANGTGLRRLTRAPTFDGAPAWSPDGTKIVFARGGTDDSTSIYVINANGTGLRRVTTNQTPNGPIGTSPDWQPLP